MRDLRPREDESSEITKSSSTGRVRAAACLPAPITKAFRSWHNQTWWPSQPGFLEGLTGPGNLGEEGMRLFPSLLKGILLFWPLRWRQRSCSSAVIVAPSRTREIIPVVLQGMCRCSPDSFHPSCTSPKSLCVCVLLTLTKCHVHVHVTTVNAPSHKPSHLTSRCVPMHQGGQLTSLSSWQTIVLPSLPRVHLVLPLLPQGRLA